MCKNKMKLKNNVIIGCNYLRLCFVMPTFNREKTLGTGLGQISSQILNSKYREFISVVISENHSTDKSAEIANNFSSKYDFISIITPEIHLPSGEHNLFFALRHISSDYVWSFADDDLILPGTIDWIYERLLECNSDFILINSQYLDSAGQVLRDRILETYQDTIYFDSFSEIFAEIGPLTLLASFSSVIYRPEKMIKLDLEEFLSPCPIYAHVFAYLEAFAYSQIEVLSVPLVVLRRTTETAHWENVAKRFGWYMYYPWTGSLATNILRARSKNLISVGQYGFALNSNENGRYGLIANMLVQFVLQMFRALETGDPREIPSPLEFKNIREVVQDIPYISVDTLDLLIWGEKYFSDMCLFLAPKGSILESIPNELSNTIHTLDFSKDITTIWITKIRDKLTEKLHAIKSVYVNFGTISPESRPFIFMGGKRYVIFQLGSHFILMSRIIYQEDWRLMEPNRLDPVDRPPDWFIFGSFEAALSLYFKVEQSENASEQISSDKIIVKIAKTPPWEVLSGAIESEDVQSFIDAVSDNYELREVRQISSIILDSANSQNSKFDIFQFEQAREGFIDPSWYRGTYSPRTQGMEREILQKSPVLHYIMLGASKGWSLSPFFDEFYYMGIQKHIDEIKADNTKSLSDRIGLAIFFAKSGKSNEEFSPFFSVESYLDQCKYKNILIENSPVIHFLTNGINLGLTPHPDWDESAYMDVNRDVKLSSGGKPFYGWIHWCMHGRFEKRIGAGSFIKENK